MFGQNEHAPIDWDDHDLTAHIIKTKSSKVMAMDDTLALKCRVNQVYGMLEFAKGLKAPNEFIIFLGDHYDELIDNLDGRVTGKRQRSPT
ncbi:MAG: hypothetical protein JNM52_06190 [Betaproteobacteria bacterium]|nr:hypothetical protein [Betaproteobacteria bacterium]